MKLGQMRSEEKFGGKRHMEEILFHNEGEKYVVQLKDLACGLTIRILIELFFRKEGKGMGKALEDDFGNRDMFTTEKNDGFSKDKKGNEQDYMNFSDKKIELDRGYKVEVHVFNINFYNLPYYSPKNIKFTLKEDHMPENYSFSNEKEELKVEESNNPLFFSNENPDFTFEPGSSKNLNKIGIKDFLFEGSDEMKYGTKKKEEEEMESKTRRISGFLGEFFFGKESNTKKEVEITKTLEMKPAISKAKEKVK